MADRAISRGIAAAAALAVALFFAFALLWDADFVNYDDDLQVYQNPFLNPVSAAHVLYFWRHPYQGLYIPLAYTGWALLALAARSSVPRPDRIETGGLLDPHVFHLANLAVHIAVVFLVWVLLRMLVRHDGPAAMGALLFGLHPVQVESVAWISEWRGLLCGLLGLMAFCLYVHGIQLRCGGQAGRESLAWQTAAMAAGLAALLCKPSAVALPLVALALDRGLLGRPWPACLRSLAPWLALSLPFAWITRQVQPVPAALALPPLIRLIVAGDALSFYLAKLILPLNLGIDYGRTPQSIVTHGWVWLTAPAPVLVAAALWLCRRRFPAGPAAGAVACLAVLPVLGLVPFAFQQYSTVADRYLYLAMLGPAVALAAGLARAKTRSLAAGCAGVLLLLGILSFVQAGFWRDSQTLLVHALNINPASPLAHNNLGNVWMVRAQVEDALGEYRLAVHFQPDDFEAWRNLAGALLRAGRPEDAGPALRQAIRLHPEAPDLHDQLGAVLASEGHLTEAVAEFRQTVRRDPASFDAHLHLAGLWQRSGNLVPAAAEYRRAILLRPDSASAHAGLGKTLDAEGQAGAALDQYRQAIALDPVQASALRAAMIRAVLKQTRP